MHIVLKIANWVAWYFEFEFKVLFDMISALFNSIDSPLFKYIRFIAIHNLYILY